MRKLYGMFDWFDLPPLSRFEKQLEEILQPSRKVTMEKG